MRFQIVLAGFAVSLMASISSTIAQTIPGAPLPGSPIPGTGLPANPSAPSPVTISPIQPASVPTSGLPANIITPSTTNQLQPSTPATGRFSGAGRGLPGMPGGPPLNSSLGAQDPSNAYMTPPIIDSLLCDPAIDGPC